MNMRIPATIALFLAALVATRAAAETPVPQTPVKAGDAAIASRPKVEDVWVAFKTHFDIGYTDTIAGVLHKYRVPMMDNAWGSSTRSRNCRPRSDSPGPFRAGRWRTSSVLGRSRPAEPRIEQAVREGTLAVQALPFSLHTETSTWKTWCAGLRFPSPIAREYGRPLPIAAKMTDVPCHSWVWPTL